MTPDTVSAGELPNAIAPSTTGQNLFVADAAGTVAQFAINPSGALSLLSPFQVPSGQQPGGIAVTRCHPGRSSDAS